MILSKTSGNFRNYFTHSVIILTVNYLQVISRNPAIFVIPHLHQKLPDINNGNSDRFRIDSTSYESTRHRTQAVDWVTPTTTSILNNAIKSRES